MFVKTIGKNKALHLLDKGAKLFDVRDPVSFRDGTITGASNLSLRNVSTLMKLPKNTKLIFFGTTDDDENLKAIINYVLQFGFTEVYSLGSKENWDK